MRCISVVSDNSKITGLNPVKLIINSQALSFSLISLPALGNIPIGPNQILVRKIGFSINFRDRALCSKYHSQISGFHNAHRPIGSEFVGIVEKMGENVDGFKLGQRVMPDSCYLYSNGTFVGNRPGVPSNYASIEYEIFDSRKLINVPSSMPDSVAASFSICAQTAYSMIRKSGVSLENRVLVTAGSSNTSMLIISILLSKGIEPTVLTSNPGKVEKLRQMGASRVVVLEEQPENELKYNSWNELVGNHDIIFDTLFDKYFIRLLPNLEHHGKYITCGFYDQLEQDPVQVDKFQINDLLRYIMVKNISIIGNCLGDTSDLKSAISDYEKKRLNIEIDSIFSDSDWEGFLRRSFEAPDRFGKAVLLYNI